MINYSLSLDKTTLTQTNTTNRFYTCTGNLTSVTITKDEMELLDKGLKHSMHFKPRNWIDTVIEQLEEIE
jgi:hypothetical protein